MGVGGKDAKRSYSIGLKAPKCNITLQTQRDCCEPNMIATGRCGHDVAKLYKNKKNYNKLAEKEFELHVNRKK